VFHISGVANFGGGACEDKFGEALGRVGGEPHASRSAHGKTAEMEAIELQGIGEGEDVFRQLLDGIRAFRDRRFSVAARVVAKDTEGFQDFRDSRICGCHMEKSVPREFEKTRAGLLAGPSRE
jgi:hypothetical protein